RVRFPSPAPPRTPSSATSSPSSAPHRSPASAAPCPLRARNCVTFWPAHGAGVVRLTRESGGTWDPAASLTWVQAWGWPEGTRADDRPPEDGPSAGYRRVEGQWLPPGPPPAPVTDIRTRKVRTGPR